MTHVRNGRAVDDAGAPLAGTQVFLVDSQGRLRRTLPRAGGDGSFTIAVEGDLEPGLQVMLAHPDYLRMTGPLPADESTVVSFEMRKKGGPRRTAVRGGAGARIAFVERGRNGFVVVFDMAADEQGRAAIGVDPSCSVRMLPFAEHGGALRRLNDSMELVDFPALEALATDLRYKEVEPVRRADREITFRVGPDLHLRFFLLPKSFDEAVALAPLVDAFDSLRDVAFQGVHPNFCALVRAGVTHGIGYVAHRVPGESLEEIVKKRGPLSDGECMAIHRDLEPAVAALESRGMVHGNLAPRFVFRGPESWQAAPPCPALPAGWAFARDARIHDGLSGGDRFGLGVTLHFAATGRDPQFDPPKGGAAVGPMDTLRGPFQPTGKSIDGVLKSLLQ